MIKNEILKVDISEEVVVEVQPHEEHEWLLSSKDVAESYGLSEGGLRNTKFRYKEELEEGKHYLTVSKSNAQSMSGNAKARQVVMWTKKGVIRLGFLIKTPLAKHFRDWAEDFIIKKSEEEKPAVPMTYIEALEQLIEKEKKLLAQAPKMT